MSLLSSSYWRENIIDNKKKRILKKYILLNEKNIILNYYCKKMKRKKRPGKSIHTMNCKVKTIARTKAVSRRDKN